MRFSQIGMPILPTPIKPMVSIAALDAQTTNRPLSGPRTLRRALFDFYPGGIRTGAPALQISHLPPVWEHNLLKTQNFRSVLGRMTSGSDDVAGLKRALVPTA